MRLPQNKQSFFTYFSKFCVFIIPNPGAPVGMGTWEHVHTKFWQNLIKSRNSILFQLIQILSFTELSLMANILRSQLYTFSNIFEAKENLVLIWKYILLITSNLVLDIYHLKLQELSSLFYCFLFQMQVWVLWLAKTIFPIYIMPKCIISEKNSK